VVIDGMKHLEVVGKSWEGLEEEMIRHYDAAGIDKGVVMATRMPSRESNDRTRDACQRYPDRFNPWVEKAKIDTLRLPAPYRTPPLTDDEYALIMGGNMARLLDRAGGS
jgi:hypothetical protein